MNDKNIALFKGLVHVMWADGEIVEAEREMLGRILTEMGCSSEEIVEIAGMMKNPPKIDDIKQSLPDEAARDEVMRIVMAMSMSDGNVAGAETSFIKKLANHLDISDARLAELNDQVIAMMKNR